MVAIEATLSSSQVTSTPVDAGGFRDYQALTEDLGGVAEPALSGQDAVADVSSLSGQEFVELVPDRSSADDQTVDVGHEERRGKVLGRQTEALTVSLESLELRGPGGVLLVTQSEREVLVGHRSVGSRERRFVVQAQWPQAQVTSTTHLVRPG